MRLRIGTVKTLYRTEALTTVRCKSMLENPLNFSLQQSACTTNESARIIQSSVFAFSSIRTYRHKYSDNFALFQVEYK